jgi:hypothetical protein
VAASTVAFRAWFRLYTIVSLVVMTLLAGLTGRPVMNELANNLPTPWLGAFERVNAYAMFAWTVVLAVVLLGRTVGQRQHIPDAERVPAPAGAERPTVTTPRRWPRRYPAPRRCGATTASVSRPGGAEPGRVLPRAGATGR